MVARFAVLLLRYPAMSPTPLDDVPGSVSATAPPPSSPAPKVLRTRQQRQAAEIAEQAQTRASWKRAMPGAQLRWPKLDQIELVQSLGNKNRLAGLVQLRYQLTREQADQQVAEFLAVPA